MLTDHVARCLVFTEQRIQIERAIAMLFGQRPFCCIRSAAQRQ
jgi:hypothetical protein